MARVVVLALLVLCANLCEPFHFPREECYHNGREQRCTMVRSLKHRQDILRGDSPVQLFTTEEYPNINIIRPRPGEHVNRDATYVEFEVLTRPEATGMSTAIVIGGLTAVYLPENVTRFNTTLQTLLKGRTDIVIQTREIGAGLDTRSAARAVEVFVEDVHFDASKRQIHFGPHGLLKCQQSMMHAATESVIRCYCSNLTPGADGRVRGTGFEAASLVDAEHGVAEDCGSFNIELAQRDQLRIYNFLVSHFKPNPSRPPPRNERFVLLGADSAELGPAFHLAVQATVWSSLLDYTPIFVLVGDWSGDVRLSPHAATVAWIRARGWHVSIVERSASSLADGVHYSLAQVTALFSATGNMLGDAVSANPYILTTSTRYLPLRPEFWTTSRDWNQRIHLYNAFGAGQLANCDHGNAASLFDSVMQVEVHPQIGMRLRDWRSLLGTRAAMTAADGYQLLQRQHEADASLRFAGCPQREADVDKKPCDSRRDRALYMQYRGVDESFYPSRLLSERLHNSSLFPGSTELVDRQTWNDRRRFDDVATTITDEILDIELHSDLFRRHTWSKLSHTLHMLGARQELDSLSGFRDEFEAVVDGQHEHDEVVASMRYLEATNAEDLFYGYFQYHKHVVAGRLKPRFYIHKMGNTSFGWGNLAHHMASSFLYAVVTRRAFVMDSSSYHMNLHEFFDRPGFEWDYTKIFAPGSTMLRDVRPTCLLLDEPGKYWKGEPALPDQINCLMADSYGSSWKAIAEDEHFRRTLRILGSQEQYTIIGHVSRWLYFPSARLQPFLDAQTPAFEGKFVLGMQLRHSNLPGDDHLITSKDNFDMFIMCGFGCAMDTLSHEPQMMADESSTEAVFVASDTTDGKDRARAAFGPNAIIVEQPAVHLARTQDFAELAAVFVDWFLFSYVDDAVLALGSTFAWSAWAMRLRPPVTPGLHHLAYGATAGSTSAKYKICSRGTWRVLGGCVNWWQKIPDKWASQYRAPSNVYLQITKGEHHRRKLKK